MATVLYHGTAVNPASMDRLEVLEDCTIVVCDGVIQTIYRSGESVPETYSSCEAVDFEEGIIIPAFSDLHIHASQYVERGVGMDCLLFEWLNRYTFPQESRFVNPDYAKVIYAQVIHDLLLHGTMHANLFTTIHYDSCDLFFRMLEESGLYAYASKINMDMNSPEYYVEDTSASLAETERFICEHIGGRYSGRVQPIIVPRFAPTCSEPLLKGLGNLAAKYGVGLHTHLVESREEAAWAKELFPQFRSDGEIYEQCGLLQGTGPKIFAHVIFPTEVEEDILKRYNAVSVHCPDATTNITAGIMPASRLNDSGLRIAMGTDVGGGHYIGLYRQICRAVQLSKMKEFYELEYRRLRFANAFYMATAVGGSVFGKVGKLEPGYRFDALVLDGLQDDGYTVSVEECVERFCYIGDDRNIVCRIMNGNIVDPEEVLDRILEL